MNTFVEGIQLTSYHRLGTIHVSKPSIQRRSGSDPSEVANVTTLGEAIEKLNTSKDSTLRCDSKILISFCMKFEESFLYKIYMDT